jgi:hypothetical protein
MMPGRLEGRTIAFLVANAEVEQVECRHDGRRRSAGATA